MGLLSAAMAVKASPLTVTVLGRQKSVAVSVEHLIVSLYPDIFYCMEIQLGAQKSVTVRGELLTVSL